MMWSIITLSITVLFAIVRSGDALLTPAASRAKFYEKFGIKNYQARSIRYSQYTQWCDHFDPDDYTTFDQKIFINDMNYFFGPVFIFVSSQLDEYEYWLENSYVSEINKEEFGVVYGIEPRFYGDSQPTEDLSVENLRLLTMDQTLADIASFVRFLRTQLVQNKFILFGYGDGGALATLVHQTYPDLFDCVWAVGAPTYIRFDFFHYFPDIDTTLFDYDASCAKIVNDGLIELDALFVAGDITKIHDLFGFQNRINLDNSNEVSTIFYTIISLLASNLEFGTQTDLSDLCRALVESDSNGLSPIESIAQEVNPITQNVNPSWIDRVTLLSATSWDSPAALNGERQYWYTACTQRAFFRSSQNYPVPIRSRFLINVFLAFCYDIFAIGTSDIVVAHSEANAKYRLRSDLPNVIFTYGALDPFRIAGQSTELNEFSPAEVIPGFGKIFELLDIVPQEDFTAEMHAVRARVRSHILSIIHTDK